MKYDEVCLVMTACIAPSAQVKALTVRDEKERRKQYLEAARFYIEKTRIQHIVFCDNSDAEEIGLLKKLAKENRKQFEWLRYQGDEKKAKEQGKGYGEGEILTYVLQNSKLLQGCRYMAKVTGRLKVRNMDMVIRLLDGSGNYFNSYVDQRNRFFIDTRFFVVSLRDYESFLKDCYQSVNDSRGFYLENSVARAVRKKRVAYHVFPVALDIEGVSGTSGMEYVTPRWALYLDSAELLLRMLLHREKRDWSILKLEKNIRPVVKEKKTAKGRERGI